MTSSQINNILSQALNQSTLLLKKEKLTFLIAQLRKQSDAISLKQQQIMNYDSIINSYMNQGMSRESSITQGYLEGKIDINISEKEQQLMASILNGYETVGQIRQRLTGQKILYQIGAGSKTRETILEGTLSFEELSPYLYIEKRTQGYSIRIKVSQTMLRDVFEKRVKQSKDSVNEVLSFYPQGSTLYSAVYRYFTKKKLGPGGVGNWGNFYQVYRLLYHKSTKRNLYKPREKTIANAFSQVLSGGGKSGSFAAGGDVLREQDKASFGSNPTLTSTRTVVNALKDLANNLQIFVNSSSIQPIMNMLIKKNVANKVERKAYEQAVETLKQVLAGIPGVEVI